MNESLFHRTRRLLRRHWRQSWATWATRAESAAVVRLIAAAATAGVPAATMLDAWAEDSRGGQGTRLEKAARLLRQGATASEAVASVPGLVQDDHAVAVDFGERTNLLGPVVQTALAGDDLLDPEPRRGFRAAVGYLIVVLLLVVLVTAFLALVISPQLLQILEEFDGRRPVAFDLWRDIVSVAGRMAWLPLAVAAGAAVVRLSPPLRRLLLRPFRRPRRMTAAIDLVAVAIDAGIEPREAATTLADCQVDPRLAARLAALGGSGPLGASLAAVGLVDASEAAQIDASAASGTLMMHQIAAARRARFSRRMAAIGQAVPPAIVFVVGLLVFVQAVAVFSALTEMIHGLV